MKGLPDELNISNKRINRAFIKIGIGLFLYGLLLPTQWKQWFGILADPILWVSSVVPSIQKLASASKVPDIFIGFWGTAFLFIPVFYAIIISQDSLKDRFEFALKNSNIKRLFGVYLFGLPVLILILYLIWFFPSDYLGSGNTRGQLYLKLMLSYRFSLSLLGSLITLGLCGLLWMLTIFLVGPFLYAFRRGNDDV